MLVNGNQLLYHAMKEGYAIPALNFANMENLQAIIEAAEECNAPVIIQTTQGAIDYAGFEYLADIAMGACKRAKVPVALHLDHGQDFNYHLQAIRLGWTSLMIDASQQSFDENVKRVNQVIAVARPLGISVEAELGVVGGKEDNVVAADSIYTEWEDAVRYYEQTHCDSLAIAVGTSHGIYKGEVKIDYDRIQRIREEVPIPLVLHGSSGVPNSMISKAVESGINKVNYDTELKLANLDALEKFFAGNPGEYDIRKMYRPGRNAMKETVKEKIRACFAENRSHDIIRELSHEN